MDDFLNKEGRLALRSTVCYLERLIQDKENQRKFEEWYKQTYGEDYVWKYAYCSSNLR